MTAASSWSLARLFDAVEALAEKGGGGGGMEWWVRRRLQRDFVPMQLRVILSYAEPVVEYAVEGEDEEVEEELACWDLIMPSADPPAKEVALPPGTDIEALLADMRDAGCAFQRANPHLSPVIYVDLVHAA